MVLMVPQPVNQIELAKTAHFSHVKDLRIVFSPEVMHGWKSNKTQHVSRWIEVHHPALKKIRYWHIPYTLWGKVSVRHPQGAPFRPHLNL
jgi:hypothetical protein